MGLLHGDASWDGGQGLGGIARDIYEAGESSRSSARKITAEKSAEIVSRRKEVYEQFLEEIKEKESSEKMVAEIDGELRPFTIEVPQTDCRGNFRKTIHEEWMTILSIKVDVEYVESNEFSSLYRPKGSNGPYVNIFDLKQILLRMVSEAEKQRIKEDLEMESVKVGKETMEVPTFISINHPHYYGKMWALLGNTCYPVHSRKVGYVRFEYIIDDSRKEMSLDELYSF